VNPRDPNTVFVAALGHVYGPHADRGVYRSTDGGATWQKVLYQGDSVGAIDVAFDPSNPQTIYAAMWAVRRPPWFIYAPANGPGSGLFKSIDGGKTWNQLSKGLPTEGLGRMGIAISAASPKRIYIVADAKEGGLFRSEDAGATFTKVSADNLIWTRGWYFEKIAADPKNADVVYIPNSVTSRPTVARRGGPAQASWANDYHMVRVSPDDSMRMIVGDQNTSCPSTASRRSARNYSNRPRSSITSRPIPLPCWLTAAQQDSGPSCAERTHPRGHLHA
jgi:hypothetical protein